MPKYPPRTYVGTRPCTSCGRPERKNSRGRNGGRVWCSRCRHAFRRWGDPEQRPVKSGEWKPAARRVENYLARSKKRERLEHALGLVFEAIRDVALDQQRALNTSSTIKGAPWRHRVVDVLLDVTSNVSPVQAGAVAAGLFLMRDEDPQRFLNDRAFLFALARVWKSQGTLHRHFAWNAKLNRNERYFQDLPILANQHIGQILAEAYTQFAAWSIRRAQRERDEREFKNIVFRSDD